ncbi:hypothetical protein SteCoe_4064 [Stentor coeruleus]|uniref:Uncharacterized protein n=1 Tax=Stentor coeruleus TaxID=5963 RepID=A0A1R2CVE2_9CILI|nr:hypothetical protein SteCoe_4064 [Stentor coeruleus]
MEDQKSELKNLKEQLKCLTIQLNKQSDIPERVELSKLLREISTLASEILAQKALLRENKATHQILRSNPLSNISEVKNLQNLILEQKEVNENLKNNILERLDYASKNFKGKITLQNQLKRLLQKVKEKFELKGKIKIITNKRNEIQEEYAGITKKLSEDNSLTLKIKYLEDNLPGKIENVNKMRTKLGQLRAQIQEIKLNQEDYSQDVFKEKIAEITAENEKLAGVKESMQKELKSIEEEIEKVNKLISPRH